MAKKIEMAYIGIDPGKTGAAALLTNSRGCKVSDWAGMGAARETILIWATECEIIKIGLEDPSYLPHRSGFYGVKGLWRNVGQWEGLLTALGLDWVSLRPQVWRRIIPRNPGKKTKQNSVDFVRKILPKDQTVVFKKGHHNRAEALLIAMYLREADKVQRRRIQ